MRSYNPMHMKSRTALAGLLVAATILVAPALPAQQALVVQGEVLEVKDVDSYTYLLLKTREGETWAAVTKAPVKTGARVTIEHASVMLNFESKTLKRKFDRIVFGSIASAGAGAAAPMTSPMTSPHGGVAAAGAPVAKVPKASGADARTVAEVVTGKAGLKDKAVLVRGQVVKVSLGIMGKNWLHLQDGSGSAAAGSNDILVTSKDAAAVGDIVTAKGTVRTDVTLGAGYAYAVLIDDAALLK